MAKDKVEAFATFEKDLLNDLIPFVEKKYPVKKTEITERLPDFHGGGQTLNFGLGNIDRFAWWELFLPLQYQRTSTSSSGRIQAKELKLLWISCGDQDR
ncbi:hypothetical protein EJ377_17775 [Chryseobacterium arthrosphaerae]|uniref:Uncharacterized protein n=1 Tax=Chryseobacterium arthrosphaerae TaxID=651561 RepID=A0A3S0PNV9_9FLAO|nr:hypothetical protein EJ377_17775 [Chryseobacterium arthrosphaerae]